MVTDPMGMGSEVILMSYREREVNSTVKINKRKFSEMKKRYQSFPNSIENHQLLSKTIVHDKSGKGYQK